MSESSDENEGGPGIRDEDLPEDLRPTDDNPLAKNPSDADEPEGQGTAGGMPDPGSPG